VTVTLDQQIGEFWLVF